jgi:hypothetical protein
MAELLPFIPRFPTFLTASMILAVTPGPGVLYIVTRSLTEVLCISSSSRGVRSGGSPASRKGVMFQHPAVAMVA